MRKVVLNEFGGPENLTVENAEDLVPAAGEVLIDVEAAGVNFLDVTQRSGASAVHLVALRPEVEALSVQPCLQACVPGFARRCCGSRSCSDRRRSCPSTCASAVCQSPARSRPS